MHDPGDEQQPGTYFRERLLTPAEEYPTPPMRVPDGGDPHVSEPTLAPEAVAGAQRNVITRFFAMQQRLLSVSMTMGSQGLELQTGRQTWTEETRREWMGRLRRLGIELDTYLSSSLP